MGEWTDRALSARQRWHRRVKQGLLVWMTVATAGLAHARPVETRVPVVIVGAGAAGLMSADILRAAGVSHVVLEATDRAGGRISSRPDNSGLGLMLDVGANLINSTDTHALKLLQRFQISYVERLQPGSDHMAYVLGRRYLTQKQVDAVLFARNPRALWQMAKDQNRRAKGGDAQFEAKLLSTPISTYLKELGAHKGLQRLLESFFWSEYGKRLQELNLHVLFDYFHVDLKKQTFHLIPNADEAYTVPGGVEQITTALARLNHESIRYNQPVTRIYSNPNQTITVESSTALGVQRVVADHIVFAAPLHSLQRMDVQVTGVSAEALQQARAVSYGSGGKLHLKFAQGFHVRYPFNGILVTDTGEQIWTSSLGQNGAGLLTVLTSGLPDDLAQLQARVHRVLQQLELVAPGISTLYLGFEKTDAAATYSSAYRPGESADIALNSVRGRWITVGEASGGALQGYVEGALASAHEKTQNLVRSLAAGTSKTGLKAPLCENLLSHR